MQFVVEIVEISFEARFGLYGKPSVTKLSIARDKSQSLELKYQSLVMKLNR